MNSLLQLERKNEREKEKRAKIMWDVPRWKDGHTMSRNQLWPNNSYWLLSPPTSHLPPPTSHPTMRWRRRVPSPPANRLTFTYIYKYSSLLFRISHSISIYKYPYIIIITITSVQVRYIWLNAVALGGFSPVLVPQINQIISNISKYPSNEG